MKLVLEMTNVWIEKSVKLAESKDYLLKVSRIYPATIPPRRPLDQRTRKTIETLHENRDGKRLLSFLLDLRRKSHPFPIEHPYVPLLGKREEIFNKNPGMVKIVANILLNMNVDDIIKGCERPPDINRIMGQAFRKWVRSYFPGHGYPVLSAPKFDAHSASAILDAANKAIMDYVRRKLGIDLGKGRDILAKIVDAGGNISYVVGEARFLSTSGGSQTRDLREVLSFVRETNENLIRIGILDGVMWFEKRYLEMIRELKEGEYVLSALLLKDFLDWLRQRSTGSII